MTSKMNIYSVDVRLYATAYIKAENEAQALEIAKKMKNEEVYLDYGEETPVSGATIDFDLPDVSFSPIACCYGPDEDQEPSLALGEDE